MKFSYFPLKWCSVECKLVREAKQYTPSQATKSQIASILFGYFMYVTWDDHRKGHSKMQSRPCGSREEQFQGSEPQQLYESEFIDCYTRVVLGVKQVPHSKAPDLIFVFVKENITALPL